LFATQLRVDGPYGSSSEDVFGFRTIVCVGAGIGVTPFASILRSIQLQHRLRCSVAGGGGDAQVDPPPKVHFYWVCRSLEEFNAFKCLLLDIVGQKDLAEHFVFNTYATGQVDLKKVASHVVSGASNYNQFTGRPNWAAELKKIGAAHAGEQIGVFMCGPPPIAAQLRAACKSCSQKSKQQFRAGKASARTKFIFHKENF